MASISLLSAAPSPLLASNGRSKLNPCACLTLLTRSRSPVSLNVAKAPASRPALLHCSFIPSSSSSISFTSSLSGLSLGLDLSSGVGASKEKRPGLVVRAGKAALGQTRRSRSRKSLARTHGFRRRMRTTSGRAVLKRRRAKGRWVLCPKSYPRTGKRA